MTYHYKTNDVIGTELGFCDGVVKTAKNHKGEIIVSAWAIKPDEWDSLAQKADRAGYIFRGPRSWDRVTRTLYPSPTYATEEDLELGRGKQRPPRR